MSVAVGKKLWWVGSDNARSQREVEVLAVGKKWAALNNNKRIDIKTLEADGGKYLSDGRCYESKAIFDELMELKDAWQKFRASANAIKLPQGITHAKIAECRALLNL